MNLRPRILIVEEDPHVTALEAVVANRCGCLSDIASDTLSVLDSLETDPPDVLLLGSPAETQAGSFIYDVLAQRLRELGPRTIILTTRREDTRLLAKAASAGVFAVVSKPFDIATLGEVIMRCVRNDGRETQVMWIGVHPATMIEAVDPTWELVNETVH